MSRGLIYSLGLLVAIAFGPSLACAQEPYVLGVFPRTSAKETHNKFTAMVRYLSATLGREVRLETSKDFDSFWRAVAAKRYDMVHFNQLHYLKSKKQFGYDVVLQNEEFGKTTIAAAIAVTKKSGIREVQQLKGKKVVFGGGPTAMVSYVAAKYLLMDLGLAEGSFQEDFALNPPNAMIAVFYDQAMAAGIGDVAPNFSTLGRNIDMDQMEIIAKGEELPQLPWAVRDGLGAQERKRFVDALLELNNSVEGKQILSQAGLTGIREANDADYDGCRRIILRVTGEEL